MSHEAESKVEADNLRQPLPFLGHSKRNVRRIHITLEDYIRETSAEQKEVLERELSTAVIRFLMDDVPVNLEGFGLLSPSRVDHLESRTLSSKQILWSESRLKVTFEKCFTTGSSGNSPTELVAGTKELAAAIEPFTPSHFGWDDHQLRRYIRGFIKKLLHETIVNGKSDTFSSLGTFYSLHNRQGLTVSDWFAGADIFLKQDLRYTVKTQTPRIYERPLLRDSFELFESTFGPADAVLSVSVKEELSYLGYDTSALQDCKSPLTLNVKTFSRHSDSGTQIYFCTDGLRQCGFASCPGDPRGVEFVCQMYLNEESDTLALPDWPLRLLTLGWILLESSRTSCPGIGVGIGADKPLAAGHRTTFSGRDELTIAFINSLSLFPAEYLCESGGTFRYLNLVGITEREAALARHSSATHLIDLLRYRGLDQVTIPGRGSLVSDEVYNEHEAQVAACLA